MLVSALGCVLLLVAAWRLRAQRVPMTLLLASVTWWLLWRYAPFPQPMDNPLLALVANGRPGAYVFIKTTWALVLFVLPCYVWFPLLSRYKRERDIAVAPSELGVLPAYPAVGQRRELFVILGELHYPEEIRPHPAPRWCEVPEAGLSRGVMILGVPGTGKTSSLMLPIANQILGHNAHDWSRRSGGLVLEVKMDFCREVRSILRSHGRGDDYLEVGFESDYVYNPLHTNDNAAELAWRLISVLRTMEAKVGRKDNPFWEQSARGMCTFLIMLYRLIYGYVTLRDLYIAASNTKIIDEMMGQASDMLERDYILIQKSDYLKLPEKFTKELNLFNFDTDDEHIRLAPTEEVNRLILEHEVLGQPGILVFKKGKREETVQYKRVEPGDDPITQRRRQEYESAKIYYATFKSWGQELRTNVAATLTTLLQYFDTHPAARRIFCPARAAYDPVLNQSGQYGKILPPLEELLETPKVLALAMPTAVDESVARIAGGLLKQNWQRAMLTRKDPQRWQGLYIDEYHLMATAGGAEPGGDEKFFNLSRQYRCIPVVATQSLSSLRVTVGENEAVITQALQTKVCCAVGDPATAEWFSTSAGPKDVLREHWNVSEGQSKVVASIMGPILGENNGSMNVSRGWNEVREPRFERKMLHELPDGCAIACVYDGFNRLPPSLLFLQPYGSDHSVSWFTVNAKKLKRKEVGA